MEQHRLSKGPLLDPDGNLLEAGYASSLVKDYDRNAIKAKKSRIKEWDFYQISNSRYVMQVTMADISLGGAANVTLFDMQTGKSYSAVSLRLLSFGRFGLSETAMSPQTFSRHKLGFNLDVNVTETGRTIKFN